MGQFSGVRPLFDDTEKIIRWVREKGIYAFRAAKSRSVKYMSSDLVASLEKETQIVGADPYSYELGEREKKTLQALMRYQIEQGLMKKELPVESLFVSA